MTAEECVAVGGHCWVDGDTFSNIAGRWKMQRCKHCPARRSGKAREPWEWTDTTLGAA